VEWLVKEMPDGEVLESLRLLLALVDAAGPVPPPLVALAEENIHAPAGIAENLKKIKSRNARRKSNTDDSEVPTESEQPKKVNPRSSTERSVEVAVGIRGPLEEAWVTSHLVQAMMNNREDRVIQVRVLKLLGTLFAAGSKRVLREFENSGQALGGGIGEVIQSLDEHNGDSEVVSAGLYAMCSAMSNRKEMRAKFSDVTSGLERLVNIVFSHLEDVTIRRRGINALWQIRETDPSLTIRLTELWTGCSEAARSKAEAQAASKEDILGPMPASGRGTPQLPPDVRRFGALLRLHRYGQPKEEGAPPHQVTEVTEPLSEHTADREVCVVGLAALTKGTVRDLAVRSTQLREMPGFHAVMQQAVSAFQELDVILPAIRVLSGVMAAEPAALEDYVDTAAATISSALDAITEWTGAAWESLLGLIQAALSTAWGKQAFCRFDIYERIDEEWRRLMGDDSELARLIVKSYKQDTERILEILE